MRRRFNFRGRPRVGLVLHLLLDDRIALSWPLKEWNVLRENECLRTLNFLEEAIDVKLAAI